MFKTIDEMTDRELLEVFVDRFGGEEWRYSGYSWHKGANVIKLDIPDENHSNDCVTLAFTFSNEGKYQGYEIENIPSPEDYEMEDAIIDSYDTDAILAFIHRLTEGF